MDGTYRMLGREHELDLEREAQRRHAGIAARRAKRASRPPEKPRSHWLASLPRRLATLREAALHSR
jgi:hypothetical protein